MKYVIITPARNEAKFIKLTLDSVVSQSIKPVRWIIVDDGSNDATASIVNEYRMKYPWISLVSLEDRGYRYRGTGVVEAFYAGLEHIDSYHDFITKLDADLSFDPEYFEDLNNKFQHNDRLGIAGGVSYTCRSGNRWVLEREPEDHVHGATKVYRRACFKEIGGLVPMGGWDTIDEIRAQMKGWKVQSFNDLIVHHHRPTAKAEGSLKGMAEMGRFSYYCGYHPLAFLARGAYRIFVDEPFFLAAITQLWGYYSHWFTRQPQINDKELISYYRKKTLRKLLIWKNN